MIRGLDHVVLVVLDLQRAVEEHRARGFTVMPGGVHAGALTQNALVGLADGSYLELIAFIDLAAARGKHSWAPVAERGGGWADFALLSNDLGQDAAAVFYADAYLPIYFEIAARITAQKPTAGWKANRATHLPSRRLKPSHRPTGAARLPTTPRVIVSCGSS